jgi:hypothetical protein
MLVSAKPTTTQLKQSEAYEKIAEIDIYNPNSFFGQHSRNSVFITLYLLFLSAGIGFLSVVTGLEISKGGNIWQMLWTVLLLTAFVFFLLLPLHELIHAGTYKYFGAAHIQFKYTFNPPAVFTCAHLLVINRVEVLWLAVLPFVVITLGLSAFAYFISSYRLFFAWALLIHAFCCMGDIILISYVFKNRNKLIFNFDDLMEGKSYFFEKK